LIEWIELAARVGYRYRSELAPFALAAALLVAAAILHDNQVPPWWVALAALPVAGSECDLTSAVAGFLPNSASSAAHRC
jgi:hypothetical protein